MTISVCPSLAAIHSAVTPLIGSCSSTSTYTLCKQQHKKRGETSYLGVVVLQKEAVACAPCPELGTTFFRRRLGPSSAPSPTPHSVQFPCSGRPAPAQDSSAARQVPAESSRESEAPGRAGSGPKATGAAAQSRAAHPRRHAPAARSPRSEAARLLCRLCSRSSAAVQIWTRGIA